MKPTKVIIELSRRLSELGHKQDVKWGDWFVLQGSLTLCAYATKGFHEWAEAKEDVEHFPIPSLEDGLMWLKITFDHKIELYSDAHGFWICDYLYEEGWTKKETPHEAVLKAICQVLESKAKDPL